MTTAAAFKVRLGDGSEIGPLDADMVRTWFQKGLIGPDSPVLRPGATRWTHLAQAVNLTEWGGPLVQPKPKAHKTASVPYSAAPAVTRRRQFDIDDLRIIGVGVLLLLGAAGPGYWALHPERTIPEFDSVPWRLLFLGSLALGLLLVRAWEFGRRLSRGLIFALSFAPFLTAGVLLAKGVRGHALVVLLASWVVLSGLFALLAPTLTRAQSALSLAAVLAGWFGIVHFGYSPETPQQKAIREWASGEARYADDELGVSLDIPGSWKILKPGNPLVPAPPEARLTFAEPRFGGAGYLLAESSPHGVVSLDHYLDRASARRRASLPSLREIHRDDVAVGTLQGRQAESQWEAGGVRYRDLTTVWKDGWTYFTLTDWAPGGEPGSRARGLESLVQRFSTTGILASRLNQAVRRATREVPHLTLASAEMLMEQSAAQILDPPEAFRRSYDAATRGLPLLSKAEAKEMAALTAAMYASVPASYRTRLGAYFERVRAREMTTPQQDQEMNQLMRTATLNLSEIKRTRLQILYEKAIAAAIKDQA